MKLKIKIKLIKVKDPKREFRCDKCGNSSLKIKMYRRKVFPFGKKSKPIYYNECIKCRHQRIKTINVKISKP